MTWLFFILLTLFLLLSAVLCLTVLVQEAKSLGLGASFGGDHRDSIFGTSTAQVLKTFTAYLVTFFLGSALLLSFWSSSLGKVDDSVPSSFEEEAPLD